MPGAKRLAFRGKALADVEAAARWYAEEAGAPTAERFLSELGKAYAHIAARAASGSPRWGHALNLPGLRAWKLGRFSHLVFYVEHDSHIEVWRVLHGARDIPAAFADAPAAGPRAIE